MNIRTIRTTSSPILSEEDMLNVLGGKSTVTFNKEMLYDSYYKCFGCGEKDDCEKENCENKDGECEETDD